MVLKKSILFITSLLASSTAFAVENNTLDILGGIGYTKATDFRNEDSNNSVDLSLSGFNVNASALYSIMHTNIGSPVVGLGLNYMNVSGSKTLNNDVKANFKYSSLSTVANGGFKFVPSQKLAIFTLANLGYGMHNRYNIEVKNLGSDSLTVKNHFLYGVSVIGAYDIAQNIGVGLGLTYNKHSYDANKTSLSFNEYSANVTVSYSL